jgi:phosphoglycolate phosphatase
LRHAGPREILRRLEVPLWKLPAIARHMRALKRQPLHATPLFEGVPAILQALRAAGLSLALVSSDSEDNARRQLGDNVVLFAIRLWRFAVRRSCEVQDRHAPLRGRGGANDRDR